MAKGAYIGIDAKARKVKNVYIGVDGKARKVKKAYIGDENGIARLCWSGSANLMIGSITLGNSAWSNTITISDIPFTPKGIMLTGMTNGSASYYTVYNVYATDDGEQDVVAIRYGSSNQVVTYDGVSVSFGTDSIALSTSATNNNYTFNYSYNYVIWG